jgi:amino acid transporter
MLIVNGSSASAFQVVLNTAVSTLLFSYLLIVPAVLVLRRRFAERHRPYQVPGGNVGFYVSGAVVYGFLLVGSLATIAPSLLNSWAGIPYSFESSWGVSGARFELFTLGTLGAVILLGVIGYACGGRVRRDLVPLEAAE